MRKPILTTLCCFLLAVSSLQIYVHLQENPIRRIVRYVRPGVTNGTETGESWENAYPSLSAFCRAEAANLPSDDKVVIVYVCPPENDHYYEVEYLTFEGWVVSNKHNLEVRHATP
jgi:hypothetical protein